MAFEFDTFLFLLVLSGGALIGGLGLIWRGFQLREQRTLLEDFPTEDVESISMGPSEVSGTARAHPESGAMRAPFTTEDCLVAEWEVEEYQEDDDGGNWYTVEEGVETTPFVLDDGTGTLEVRPGDSTTFDLEHTDETLRVDQDRTPPEPIAEFIQTTPGLDPADDPMLGVLDAGTQTGDRKYHQNLLPPDHHALVFGTVQPRMETRGPDNPDAACIKPVPEDEGEREPMFLISDQTEDELIDERKWALLRLPAGAALSAIGLWGLLALLGPHV
jgi:hypothetical protein